MSDMKIGAYICQGCGIGERLDTKQLANVAQKEGKANVVREHEFLCNAQGVAMIQADIEKEGVNHVVIAACSRRAKAETFNFENVAISRANLREGVIWSQPADADKQEIVQEMADDYVRTARAKGASEMRVMLRHVLRNSMIPVLTRVLLTIPFLFATSMVLAQGESTGTDNGLELGLAPGDAISLEFWREPDLDGEYAIDERGVAVLPLLGERQVTGMPLSELRRRILDQVHFIRQQRGDARGVGADRPVNHLVDVAFELALLDAPPVRVLLVHRPHARLGDDQLVRARAHGVLLLWRLEGLAVRRPAHARHGRCVVLHPHQGDHQPLAKRAGRNRRRHGYANDVICVRGL